jgi:hypothetical protein
MNGVSAQTGGGIGNKSINKRGRGEAKNSSSIIYYYVIHNYIEHKIYDCPYKDAVRAMFKEKAMVATPKKDNVVINMVLIVTIHS